MRYTHRLDKNWVKRYWRRNLKTKPAPHKKVRLMRAQRFIQYWRSIEEKEK